LFICLFVVVRRSETVQKMQTTEAARVFPYSGFESVQGRRWNMEDAHINIDDLSTVWSWLPKDIKYSLYAVFDGHGGKNAAIAAESYYVSNLGSNKDDFAKAPLPDVIKNAFVQTDKDILTKAADEKWSAGCTAVTALIVGQKLYVANIGDSEAVLARRKRLQPGKETETDWEAILLTEKHVPANPTEAARLSDAGCMVAAGRVGGVLAVSRSFGDSEFKVDKSFVISVPHVSVTDMTENDEFLIVACDGLWDVVSYKDAVDFVSNSRYYNRTPLQAAENLVREALDRKTMDNVTCVVVYFSEPRNIASNGAKPPERKKKEEKGGIMNM